MTIDENIPLKHLTTLKIGGEARYFCIVKSFDDLREAIGFAKKLKVHIFVLGGGSNVLISDGGFGGVVIKMALKGITFYEDGSHTKVKVAAGEGWDDFVDEVVHKGLWGVENLSGIPGTIGGAVVQNIGAYGAEVSSAVESVEIFDSSVMEKRIISAEQCRFGYRESLFKRSDGRNYVITEVTFRLSKNGSPNISYKDLQKYFSELNAPKLGLKSVREAVLKIRAEKFPPLNQYGTAGSFFKNPIVSDSSFANIRKNFPEMPNFPTSRGKIKLPLAWILDKVCSFRGRKMGHVGLYDKQPLVLVNFGEATAHEVSVFADKVAADVKNKTGVEVEREVQTIGEDAPPPRYQTWFWSFVYFLMPKITALVQFFGWHHFRQNYVIGFLRKDKTPRDLINYLHRKGYSKAYMAWKDSGEVFSLRRIVRHNFQYHIRYFEDGEIRGHYEYTAESNPLGHLYEVVFNNPDEYFIHLLHGYLER